MLLHDAVTALLRDLLGDEVPDPGRFLGEPPKPEMGDLAFGCFGLAKQLRSSPAQIARDLAARVRPTELIASAEAAGPYVNFRAHPAALLARTCAAVEDGSLWRAAHAARPEKVMVEFSQPNTHKPFHVGHLRNVAIGDALVRILRARGHEVIPANYYGDFGIDVAKCLWWLRTHPDERAPDAGRTAWLGLAYTRANDVLARDERDDEATIAAKAARFAEVRAVLHAMEAQDPEVWAQYRLTRQWCLDEFADVYGWLGVRFEVDFFESEVEGPANAIVDDQLARGVFVVSDGAVVCDLQPELDVPAMVRKSDGTSLYMTWDLALAKRKFEDYRIERSLYVVGAEQKFHFRQLFATLRRMGYERAGDCVHIAYELVTLPEGKMSSRKGTAIPLHELRTAVCSVIEDRLRQTQARVPAADHAETVRRIAVACLKYGMLSVGVNKRVIFQLSDWTNPEGDTGAYLLYGLARMRSVQRLARERPPTAAREPAPPFGADEERALLARILEAPAVVERAAAAYDPSPIAGWCYETARAFSRFWTQCPVLDAHPDLREARLQLVAAADQALTRMLDLLGIEAVDAM